MPCRVSGIKTTSSVNKCQSQIIMGSTMSKSGHFLDSMQTENCHVVMLGLDSAGKTTALYRLKFDQYLNTVPTIGFNCEKVQGTIGKAKGVQFLVWDVGGQEKLRPLWRSYTRCTDGILFVVDSVDIERMEEAKMELMRTAKCPDNQGVPVLILANKQDLPGACNPKDLEKLLGLYELVQYDKQINTIGKLTSISSSSTGNIMGSNCANFNADEQNVVPKTTTDHSISYSSDDVEKKLSTFSPLVQKHSIDSHIRSYTKEEGNLNLDASSPNVTTNISFTEKAGAGAKSSNIDPSKNVHHSWYIQPACAITGEGLQEGLGALYEMILKRRKLNKVHKKKFKR